MVAFADRKFETMGRDADWRFISNNEQHMGMICIHFGGDPNVHWKIDMVRIFRSYSTLSAPNFENQDRLQKHKLAPIPEAYLIKPGFLS